MTMFIETDERIAVKNSFRTFPLQSQMKREKYLKYVVEQTVFYQMTSATFLVNSNSYDHIF